MNSPKIFTLNTPTLWHAVVMGKAVASIADPLAPKGVRVDLTSATSILFVSTPMPVSTIPLWFDYFFFPPPSFPTPCFQIQNSIPYDVLPYHVVSVLYDDLPC